MDCTYEPRSQIRQEGESGEWYTQVYLDFREHQLKQPETRYADFYEQYDEFVDARSLGSMAAWLSERACILNHTWGGVCHCGMKVPFMR